MKFTEFCHFGGCEFKICRLPRSFHSLAMTLKSKISVQYPKICEAKF
ncbi:hypothetical protein OFO01_00595 [Campylobacter sp. JMF_01 NE2]|nr:MULTISPECIES: hypothetical protein [unclassified Campylobacter]MDA3051953.1 hypothetical protein [Campylobacter sp. JMF_03 NE3]MDA3066287.1 hypothetical protein [Campylobacter sp. JMF_01 NE2]